MTHHPPETINGIENFHDIIFRSGVMKEITKKIVRLAPFDSTIRIEGPSGSGKELIAAAIHHVRSSSIRPYIEVNCALLDRNLAAVELFGAEKGAYTGLDQTRIGFVESAHEGTLFLDEAQSLDKDVQTMLLRYLDSKTFMRKGSKQVRKSSARIILATNLNVEMLVSEKRFRNDLFSRLDVHQIEVPGLDKRKEDISALAQHFIARFGKGKTILAEDAIPFLEGLEYPGNVRDLKNLIQRTIELSESTVIPAADLRANFKPRPPESVTTETAQSATDPKIRPDLSRDRVNAVLGDLKWNMAKAARRLGCSRGYLYELTRKYNLARRDPDDDSTPPSSIPLAA
jgi:DNA-binding NtrC family response regulator